MLRKEAAGNRVVLGDESELYSRTVWVENFNWVSLAPAQAPLSVTAKTRYSQSEAARAVAGQPPEASVQELIKVGLKKLSGAR